MDSNPNNIPPTLEHEDESTREILHDLEEEGIQRPPLWRQLVPWVITAVILWWIFKDINFDEFVSKLENARLSLLIPAMFLFTLVFAACDLASFGMSYRWFAIPDLSFKKMTIASLGTYLLQVLYAPLQGIAIVAYFRRHKGAPISWILSAFGFAMLNDIFVVNAVMTAAVILNTIFNFTPEIEPFWLFPLAFPWLLAYINFRYWFTDSKNRYLLGFSSHPLMRSARFAKMRHYLIVYAARLTLALAGIAAHAVALYSFGIEVPLPVLVIVAPLILMGVFLPISGGGFGGPQLVALILLPYANGDEALLAAYSMSFSASFTLARTIIGAIFLPVFLRDLKDSVPRMTVDPLTGEPLTD